MLELRWSSTVTHLSLSFYFFLQAKVAETSFLPGACSNPIWAVALRRGQPLSSSLYIRVVVVGVVVVVVVVVYHIHHHVGA